MKKLIVLALAIMLTGLVYGQSNKKRTILSIAARASTMKNYVYPGDFIYIVADSTMYQSKVSLGPSATGTYLLASSARYNVALMNIAGGAIAGTTGTFSSTLAVTGATTIGGALGITGATTLAALTSTGTANMAGALNVGTSNNKFTVAAATGNTAIAGTLNVVGALTCATDKFAVVAASGNTSVAGTLAVTGATTITGALTQTGVATFAEAAVLTKGLDINTTDTITAASVGTLCYKNSDSTLYLKVRATGTTTARWKVLSNAR